MYPGEYAIIIYPLGGHKPVRITCSLNWNLDTLIIKDFYISEAVLPTSQGVFRFPQVPNGEYKILPFFPHSKGSYKILPSIYIYKIYLLGMNYYPWGDI